MMRMPVPVGHSCQAHTTQHGGVHTTMPRPSQSLSTHPLRVGGPSSTSSPVSSSLHRRLCSLLSCLLLSSHQSLICIPRDTGLGFGLTLLHHAHYLGRDLSVLLAPAHLLSSSSSSRLSSRLVFSIARTPARTHASIASHTHYDTTFTPPRLLASSPHLLTPSAPAPSPSLGTTAQTLALIR